MERFGEGVAGLRLIKHPTKTETSYLSLLSTAGTFFVAVCVTLHLWVNVKP